MLKSAHA